MNEIKEIILASASPRRRELLQQIGIQSLVRPSHAGEETDITRPDALVEELSRRKCLDIAKETEEGIVLGADTVVSIDGKILGKPADKAKAAQMLKLLQGREHQVYTGVTLAKKKEKKLCHEETFSVCTKVFVSKMSDEEIEAYIATGEPMDKAGAYGIQGAFARHIEKIEGDYCNVVGLPLAALYERLKFL